ncbi:glycosyltransferase family 2 protein [Leucobacter zeae]|nr:glycosyltransferase family 2 protein [Leucobacter zeae]
MTVDSPDGRSASTAENADTWVVIPLYNEVTVIASVIAGLLPVFPNIVCIDDGSRDGSGEAAERAGARVVRHPINLGQGAALQTGFEYALERGAGFVVTFDADGQHRVEDAAAMLARARDEDVAIVFGSRFLDDRTDPGIMKKIVLKTAVAVTNITTRTRLTDAHNGLRVIREDALRRIKLRQDRMAHGTEIVVQLGRTGLPYVEQPVEVVYTDYSKAKGQSLLNSVNILVDLIIR